MNKQKLLSKYEVEQAYKTLKNGKILVLITIPVIVYFIFQDLYIVHMPELIYARLIFIIPFCFYLLYLLFVKNKKDTSIIVIHTIFLSSLLLMMVGMLTVVITVKGVNSSELREVINGMIITLFVVFIFIGISLKRLIVLITFPLVLSIFIIVFLTDLGPIKIFSLSSNLLFATIILIVSSIQKRSLLLSEFESRSEKEEEIVLNNELIKKLKNQIDTNKSLMEKLSKLAMRDELTGVYSRYAGLDKLKSLFEKSFRNGSFSLVFIDIDNLKLVNDVYGHDEGDRYIIYIVEIIKSNLRRYDYIFRYGGDEFILLLDEITVEKTVAILENIRKELYAYNRAYICDFSYGISSNIDSEYSLYDEMISKADNSMYIMKNNKKEELLLKDVISQF